VLDESGSMAGSRWKKAIKGAQELLEFIKKDH
jgi:uncharacterized protein YegL